MELGGPYRKTHIISTQYFIYFCLLGVFLPYFNLYCYHLGFSGFQIGLISSVRSVTLVLFALAWGSLADRFHKRRLVYIACAFFSTLLWVFFFFSRQFVPMLIITFFYGIFFSPLISFLEAFTMDILGEEKRQYGRVRAWGSISFIITVIAAGRLIEKTSVDVILVSIFAASIFLNLFAFGIPDAAARVKTSSHAPRARFLVSGPVMVFLVSAMLMLVSHGAYYGFFSIHLETLGYGSTFIGFAWALSAIAEILVMIKSDYIFRRFTLKGVLLFSFLVAVLRWVILSFAASAPMILLSQALHAATYGAFHMASILYMDHLSPDESKTLGQAMNNALTYGLGLMLGLFLSGVLYERFGGFTLFLFSGAVAAMAYVIFWVFGGKGSEQRAESTPSR